MTATTTTAATLTWDEPTGAASPRGWLMAGGMCVGFYLDYGPEHYRTGHTTQVGADLWVSFCKPDRKCNECQPGNVLAVRYPNGPGEEPHTSRYVVTLEQAREYIKTGQLA